MTLMKFWRQLPESDQNSHRCKCAKCSSGVADNKRSPMETVISTRMSHKAKRDEAQPRIVTSECADAMRVSEHYASTPSHTNAEVDDQQNGVKVSYTSTRVMRYVVRVPS